MKKYTLNLSESQQIKEFVNIVSKYSFDIDLRSGRYVVDAKSILGIFSLDLSKPVELEIVNVSEEDEKLFQNDIQPYLAK